MQSIKFLSLFFLTLLCTDLAFAQSVVKGKVENEKSESLAGALVRASGTLQAAVTDADGSFKLALNAGNYKLEICFLGYENHKIDINLNDGEIIDLGNISLEENNLMTDEFTVIGTRSSIDDPFTYSNLSKEDIEKNNLGQDLPYLLDQTPSVVVSSDAGAGIGYTGIRIRGSDPTRINVTINGIPINDSESQGLWWVNMPDFASSVDNIQIQRGLGTSSNGGAAFGASINLQTNGIEQKPYAQLSNSFGSFNSRKHTLQLGSGLINNRWSFEGRLSQISSDGFIDRASSMLRSYYLSGAYVTDKTLIRANVFSGNEETYQSWGAVPLQYVDTNRTYNPYTYENEVDNYTQTHYQLHLNQTLTKGLTLNASLHYTRGFGYFEQYRNADELAIYGIESGDSLITASDLIRRRWLDNHFYGAVYGLHYNSSKLDLTVGGAWNHYDGDHFGEVIWARFAGNSEIGKEYYRNNSKKIDGTTYIKANYRLLKNLSLYADLQHRFINYEFLGFNNALENVTQSVQLNFFNPKIGAVYFPDNRQKIYLSTAIGNREPNRNDYTENTPATRPNLERMYDTELGYSLNLSKFAFEATAYFMYYQNQLVLTGQINDVGAYMRSNVPQSYRTGLELQAAWLPLKGLKWSMNATLSQNKILAYTEYVDNWDTWGQEAIEYKNTDIAFSPALIAGSELAYDIINRQFGADNAKKQVLNVAVISKYVGKQYIDNTQHESRSLPGFLVNDLIIRYVLQNIGLREIGLNFMLRNFSNSLYSNNAWVYRFRSPSYDPRPDDPYSGQENGDFYHMIGLYPQAGINFMIGLDLKF
jgi:iron complex outermembrane receptor protein